MSRFVLTAQLQLQAPNNVAQVVRQIQSQLNNVSVNIQVQGAAQAQRQIQQIANQTNQATTAAERMGKAFAVSVRRFAAFSIATRAVGLFTSTLSDAVQTAIDFEREMIRVSQVTGESVGKLKFLTSAITELSTGLGVSSKDLLQTSQLLLQAGISAKDTEVALKTLAKAALAPNFDSLSETTEGAIAILAQFQEGVGSLEKQLGSINAVAGAFAVEAGDLIDVIRRTGGVFKASGGSLNELLALFTSVRATTRESAESIGTGLRTIFTRIQRPKTIEFLKQFGVELVDLEGKFVGPFEAVKRLSAALSGLGEGDLTFIRIAEELGGFRQIGKVLPLLQQFTTAQNALNVANAAGNSLTNDAATAQQALAIRIIKVKEEFLALVRSITETSTFQIMANTALSLASALIKLADSIKPLLPLLGAMAAVKIVKGLGGFLGGAGAGLTSGRTFNKGGKVHHFARGGMVPGTGNRDTVPAMLQPGEFVIKKSSVNKLGAGNLAAMNENRFNKGTSRRGVKPLPPIAEARGQSLLERESKGFTLSTAEKTDLQRYKAGDKKDASSQIQGIDLLTKFGISFLRGASSGTGISTSVSSLLKNSNQTGISAFNQALKQRSLTLSDISPKARISAKNAQISPLQGTGKQIFEDEIVGGIVPLFDKATKQFKNQKELNPGSVQLNELLSNSAIGSIEGQFFEAFVRRITGNTLKENKQDPIFDFKGSSNVSDLQKLFGLNYTEPNEFKNFFNDANIASAIGKALSELGSRELIFKKFATGGGVGTDTVPALLTPGEFVVNRSSAQSIGYGNLNRMNKVGKYAKGGVVQRFATGTSGNGVKSGDTLGARVSGFNPKIFAPLEKTVFSLMDVFRGLGAETTKTVQAFTFIEKSAPGLVDSIRSNTIANNRTKTTQEKVAIAYAKIIANLQNQGKSDAEIQAAISRYISALDKDTKAKLSSAASTTTSSSAGVSSAIGKSVSGSPKSASKPVISNFAVPGFDAKAPTMLNKIIAKLTGTFSIVDITLQEGAKQFSVLKSVTPNLSKALMDYANANNLTSKQLAQLSGAYGKVVGTMLKQGATDSQIAARTQTYIDALEADTKAKINAAKVTAAATQSSVMSSPSPSNPFGSMGGTMGQKAGGSGASQNTAAVNANTKAQQGAAKSAMDVVNNNKMFAASMATSLIAGFLPAVDENSGAMLRLTHSLLGFVTTIASVGFALEAFGVNLKKQAVMSFLGGGGMGMRSQGILTGGLEKAGLSRGLSQSITGIVNGLSKLVGPLAAVAGSAFIATKAFEAAISAVYNFEGRLQSAVEKGDIEGAKKVAGEKATFEGANVVRGGGATAGAIVGFILGGPIGAAIGAGLGAAAGTLAANILPQGVLDGLNEMFGGNTRSSAMALAAAQAGAVKTQKALDDAQKVATNAMADFENGTISASEALLKIRAATSEAATQQKLAGDFATKNLENRASDGFTGRNVASFLTFGAVESSSQRNQRLGQQSAEQINQAAKFQAQAFQMESPARQASIRSGFARGMSRSDIEKQALGDLQKNAREQRQLGVTLQGKGDEEGAKAAFDAAKAFDDQIKEVNREMANLEKEVGRAKAAFDAMNLGLRGPTATATAMSASMTRFAAGLEVGGNMFVANTEFLSEAVSGAAQAMDPDEIKSAMSGVKKSLEGMGLSPAYAAKFEANTQAFIQAQQNYNQAFANIKDRIKGADFTGMSADKLKEEFAKELTVGLGDDAKKNLTAIIEGMQLSEGEVDQILSGNLQVFGDKLGEAGKKQFEEIMKIAQERQKAEQVLIDLTKKRIDAERNAIEAQKEAIDLAMEGREIQGKYGGAAVTNTERRAAVVAKANAGASRLGLSEMRDGSVGDLRRRRQEIGARFGSIEGQRRVEGGMQGQQGVIDDATQADLQKAQKDQVQTIRDLIKLEEDELKIIQEKNKLEKQSLESLISGDIDKFFEQQAAVGAQAALATGDQRLINQFGGNAIGSAFSDLQRQSEAGVQSLYGQNMSGPGGLLERAGSAALASRGVQNPMATQVLAGTTGAEEASKARLRELGGELGATGELGAQMAEMQVQTASINVANAQIKMKEIEERGRAATAAATMNRGGIVYASRGIFVPKGTDTVPAMLTPGEFVVNRAAVNRGNNLQVLQAMNKGISDSSAAATGTQSFSRGGKVRYLQTGGQIGSTSGSGVSISPEVVNNLTKALEGFNTQLANNIRDLQNTKFKIALDTTNVNVNLTGGAFLASLKDSIKKELLSEVSKQINNMSVGQGGKLVNNSSTLPK